MTWLTVLWFLNGGESSNRSERPDGLLQRSANRFVAGFIGSPQINFIDGRLSVWTMSATIGIPRHITHRRHQGRKLLGTILACGEHSQRHKVL